MTNGKYTNREKGMGNCPFCRGVILRDFLIDKTTGKTSFTMRCPHCRKDVKISIEVDKITIRKPEESA
ncbi:MAG: hypothetical protein WAP51_00645 [Candidatus Sungiibacteriota bacterium]